MEEEIGAVTHFFGHISVAVIKIEHGSLKVGDTIHIKGHATDFSQKIDSMQIEHSNIEEAKPGDAIGLKVVDKVRQHDKVYKVTE
jgi:putative protease